MSFKTPQAATAFTRTIRRGAERVPNDVIYTVLDARRMSRDTHAAAENVVGASLLDATSAIASVRGVVTANPVLAISAAAFFGALIGTVLPRRS